MAKVSIEASNLTKDLEYMKKVNEQLNELMLPYIKKDNRCLLISVFLFFVFIVVFFIIGEIYPKYFVLMCIFESIILSSAIIILIYGQKKYGDKVDEYRNKMYSLDDIGTLEAGIEGEEVALQTFRELNDTYKILHGIPIYLDGIKKEKPDCELDFLILGSNGIFLVENKYTSGHIEGESSDKYLQREKIDIWGQNHYDEVKNPVYQLNKIQLKNLKKFLAKRNIDIYINALAYFSHEDAIVDIENNTRVQIFQENQDDIINYIESYNYKGKFISNNLIEKIIKVIKDYLTELDNNTI